MNYGLLLGRSGGGNISKIAVSCSPDFELELERLRVASSAVIGTSPRVPGSTFGLTRLEANSPVGIPGKYDVESTR